MTQLENEIAETTETEAEGNILERAMESVEVSETPEDSLLKTAPAALGEWVSETREVMQRHWDRALERARTRLEPVAKVVKVTEAAPESLGEDAEPAAPTPLHTLLSSAIVTRAQDRGAALLLSSMRKLRAQLEHLEANLEAARPVVAA